jgi:hypothetical protein
MKTNVIQRLALPMFISGLVAMLLAAAVMFTNPAFAAGAVGYKFQSVTLEYVSTGFIMNGSSCGSAGSSSSISNPSFSVKAFGLKDNDKWGKCKVTLTVLTK